MFHWVALYAVHKDASAINIYNKSIYVNICIVIRLISNCMVTVVVFVSDNASEYKWIIVHIS